MEKFLVFSLVLCASCAQMKTTVVETQPARAGEPARTTKLEVNYSGTSGGARDLLGAETRRVQTVQAGKVAEASIEKGMPATLGQDARRSDVQAGYAYSGMYGMYGANPYGHFGTNTAAQIEMLGQMPGYLPRLGEPPVYFQPGQPHVVQTTGGDKAGCPKDRPANSVAERLACNENDIDAITTKVGKQK